MTNKRRSIYNQIQNADQPLNAAQVFEGIKSEMDLTTVYRGLQFLEEERYISSFVFSCESRGMERYYTKVKPGHSHYMHCRKCHRFFPFPGCPLKETLSDNTEIGGFLVEEHSITLKGLCSSCR